MGNRGGRFHRDDRTLENRRFVSRRWIACVCTFKDRHRDVWGQGYTELFFIDEVTALAAGHRPCFECRSNDARRFQASFPGVPGADAMDRILHDERLMYGQKRLHRRKLDDLPAGAMIAEMDACFAVRGDTLLPWSFEGYRAPTPRPGGIANVLTPPSIVEALRAGYTPLWHRTAEN